MAKKYPIIRIFLDVNLFLVVNSHRCLGDAYCVHKIKPLVALRSSETSVTVCQFTKRSIAIHLNPQQFHCENLVRRILHLRYQELKRKTIRHDKAPTLVIGLATLVGEVSSADQVLRFACVNDPCFLLERRAIRGFCHDAEEISAFLGFYAACSGNSLLRFRDNLSVPSSRIKKTKRDGTDRLPRNVGKELPLHAA